MQYTQSNTSTQPVNISSLRRSADVLPTVRRRSAAVPPTCHTGPNLLYRYCSNCPAPTSQECVLFRQCYNRKQCGEDGKCMDIG